MKLTIIGAGSTYTPELLDGLARRTASIPLTEIWLFDVDLQRLNVLTEFSKRQLRAMKCEAKVSSTQDLSKALDGADFVVSQIRVGGQKARQKDTELGLRHNLVGQETTGCGGFACALRHIPVSVEIAREMEKRCPKAVLMNFTNPAGMVTQALRRESKLQVVGICNVPYVMAKDVADYFHVSVEDVELDYFGLNHLSWATKVVVKGVDRTKDILQHYSKLHEDRYQFDPVLIDALEALPSPYLRYYYSAPEVVQELKKSQKTRAQEVMEIESFLLNRYSDPKLSEKPPELTQRGGIYYGEVAASAMKAILTEKPERQIVNLPNGMIFPWLPEDAVIEYPWRISSHSCIAEIPIEIPEEMKSLMVQVKTYESLTIEAALTGNRKAAYLALLTNPLVGSAKRAKAVLDEVLEINQEYLPVFSAS